MDSLKLLNVKWPKEQTATSGKDDGTKLIPRLNNSRVSIEPRIELIPRAKE